MSDSGGANELILSKQVVRHTTRYAVPKATMDAEVIQEWNDFFSNELLMNKGKEVDAELGLRRSRAAILLLLGLPGSTYMYQ